MEIKIRISKIISENMHLSSQIENINQVISFNSDNLKNLIATYLQDNNDEESFNSLVRYLYWYSGLGVKDIGEMVGVSHQKVVSCAGTIVRESVCVQCKDTYTSVFSSRKQTSVSMCQTCIAKMAKENDNLFLEDWIGETELRKQFDTNMDYQKYLRSAHWQNIRRQALRLAGWKCQACSNRESILDVHHNNYSCLHQETSKDVVVLCRPCHNKIHKKKK